MFLLKRKKKEGHGPKKKPSLFGTNVSSDSDDNEDRFLKSIKSKEAQVMSQDTAVLQDNYEDSRTTNETNQSSSSGSPLGPSSGAVPSSSKYIGGLLDAASERKKTFERARKQAQDRRVDSFGGMVFKSSEYKKIRHSKNIDENIDGDDDDDDDDDEDNEGLFYNRILSAKMGESIAEPIRPHKTVKKESKAQISVKSDTSTTNTITNTSTPTPLFSNIKDLKTLIESKVTPQSLDLYKERYWKRQNVLNNQKLT
ncbi:uncharacterized protein KQ657_001166 [Scheffersomyces spartinae]|uniref:Uncharacterized protein n=1 Tax=Scheffersomyces spartinae TaxID=45513 RepID=A0A9P8AIE9_9ASCO|nr:uncharacterized protein KQ657_001166 [Scheffersomyces spartinae]KAG7193050.1 hypothetical protein KQ657_001166 [Scheffersomyces spartinae]